MKRAVASLEQKAEAEAAARAPGRRRRRRRRRSPPMWRETESAARNCKAELSNLDRQIARQRGGREAAAADRGRLSGARRRRRRRASPNLTELTRDYETLQKSYTTLLTKKEDSKIAANLERRQIGEQFKMLDSGAAAGEAGQPEPSRSSTCWVRSLGLALGLGSGRAARIRRFDAQDRTTTWCGRCRCRCWRWFP